MLNRTFDVVIIGGGIIGVATAMQILNKKIISLAVIETEDSLAKHQTGNNSGVIHSGLYYKPGSLKAQNCVSGRTHLYEFLQTHNINFERCGKLVVAVEENELPQLDALYEKGIANGLTGLKKLSGEQLKEYEPHAAGVGGLLVPETGIVDYKTVTDAYSQIVKSNGGEINTNCKFISMKKYSDGLILKTSCGEIKTNFIINCAGLYSDRVAKLCGVNPGLKIIPFRGEYFKLKNEKEYLVKNLIYPVPDPRFPFLGVHFTRMIQGGVEAGPNAVLAFKREGYSKKDFSFKDSTEMFFYNGFWNMAAKYYQMGFAEFYRSFSKKAFANALQKLIPEIQIDDIAKGGAGVRAQALEPSGKLVDDFRIVEADKMIHVLNAPSPAATASLSIGDTISRLFIKRIS